MGPATATGIVVNKGGALAFTGGLDYNTAEPITISGSGPAGNGAIENISGTNAFAIPITLSGAATIGSDAGSMTLGGNIAAGPDTLTVVGAGTTTINGNIVCQGGSVTLAGSGTITIAGNINLGPTGNLTDSSSGQDEITGVISGTATSGFVQGLTGTYFNLPAAQDLIQPAAASNPAWLGNQTPAATALLVGPIDFPDIADNGFADSVGDPAYYDLGSGINDNVEARWYGDIMVPGTGTTPVPINFATTSDDGSMLYIDGNAVVDNDNFQAATQATGLVDLTPGLHAIDAEYYQGGGAATLDVRWDPTGGTNFVDIPNSAFGEPVNNVIKTGAGTLTLSNTDTYFGSTTVELGKLVVNGSLLDTAVTVNSGGALGGDGNVQATTVQSGGVLSPGNSPGTLTAGSLSLATGSTFHEELGGTTAGSQYDQTVIPAGGSVVLDSPTLDISFLPGFLPTVGQQFTIINNRSGSGIIGAFRQGSTYTSDGFIVGINYTGGAGHDVVLTVLASAVTFLKQDTTTQGNWMGTYGAQGYDIVSGPSSLPANDTIAPAGESIYTWTTTSTDPRALQVPGSSNRVAATWYSATSFTVDVDLTDGQQHDLELYFLDWDRQGRSEQVQISNAATGAVLSTQTVSSFQSGIYLDYAISGNVLITFTKLAGANAVLSGLFLDSPPGPTATFLEQDTTTHGTWINTYGAQGYDVIGSSTSLSLPSYATVTPAGQSTYTWASSTTDPRALQVAGGSGRIAATWYSATSFTVDVDLTDGQLHDLELYFLDWDKQGRSEQVQISNAATGAVLSTQTVSSFQSGIYLDYAISGNVLITFTKLAGANAVLSGLFLDSPPGPTATFLEQDTTTHGTWINTYGNQGYDVIGSSTSLSLPSYATVTPAGQSSYTWASSTTDPRAPAGRRRRQPHRRHLVFRHQLQRGRRPHRRPAARPGALPPRLGQAGAERAGADQQRGDRRRALDPDGLVVPVGDLPRLRDQRQRPDHLHEAVRAQRRAQRPVPRLHDHTDTHAHRHVPQAGRDDARDLDQHLRQPGLRRHRQQHVPQPPLLRHRHARRPVELHLGLQHHRSPRACRSPAAPAASPPPGTPPPASPWTLTSPTASSTTWSSTSSTGTSRGGASRCRSATRRPAPCCPPRRSRPSSRGSTSTMRSAATS